MISQCADPQFPASLAASDRVLKQNRGSTGSGIWVVQPHRWVRRPGLALTPAHLLRVTQMLDNRRQVMSLADFLRLCEQYITGAPSKFQTRSMRDQTCTIHVISRLLCKQSVSDVP